MEQPSDPFTNYYIDELEGYVKTLTQGRLQGYTLSEE